jgi:hypothetical protein
LAPPKYGRVKIRNTNANASIEEVVTIDVDVASDVVEVGIVTEPNVDDVSSDAIEEEPATSDVYICLFCRCQIIIPRFSILHCFCSYFYFQCIL